MKHLLKGAIKVFGPILVHTAFLVFITLKLTGLVTWSWWWVLAPILISYGIYVIGIVILFSLFHRK